MRRCRRKTKNSIFNNGCSQTGNNLHNRIQLHESHLPINRRMAFLPLPDMEILLPLTSGLAVGRDRAGLSPHIVGIFELLGQAQYPQKRREVLRGNLLKGYADLYDSASFEAKKMIVSQLIRRVEVYRGYQIHVDFNFDLAQYLENSDELAC